MARFQDVRVGDHPDFLAPVLFDELGGHQDIPQANIADGLKQKIQIMKSANA